MKRGTVTAYCVTVPLSRREPLGSGGGASGAGFGLSIASNLHTEERVRSGAVTEMGDELSGLLVRDTRENTLLSCQLERDVVDCARR